MPLKTLGVLFLFLSSFSFGAETKQRTKIFGKVDYGFLAFLSHKAAWGYTNPEFDYLRDGGHDLLFPSWRLEGGAIFGEKHKVSVLYQPVFVKSEVVLREKLLVDDLLFSEGTSVITTYNFPFYRLNYWYLLSHSSYFDFWIGGGLLIRSSSVKFRSSFAGDSFRAVSIGPMPLLNLASTFRTNSPISFDLAATGFWAPVKYLNGGNTEIIGWLYEVEFQGSYEVQENLSFFSNIRLIGGGGIGTAQNKRLSGGRYSSDTFLTISSTAGVKVQWGK